MRIVKMAAYTLGCVGLVCLVSLLVWANWEKPSLHAQVKPIGVTLLKVDGLQQETQAQQIRQQIEKMPGVTACSANPVSQLIGITYDTDLLTESQLRSVIESHFKQVTKPNFDSEQPSGPQCPVPAEYILKMERLKYALCFR